MNNQTTIEKLKQMRLHAMAQVYNDSIHQYRYTNYTTDEYMALMVDQEWEARQSKRINNLIHMAGFRSHASSTNIDYTTPRNLNKNIMERLLTLDFIKQKQNVIITGPTGVGKSYIIQAIGNHACSMLIKSLYFNTSKLMERFKTSKLDGSYLKLLNHKKKFNLIILDDFGLALYPPEQLPISIN